VICCTHIICHLESAFYCKFKRARVKIGNVSMKSPKNWTMIVHSNTWWTFLKTWDRMKTMSFWEKETLHAFWHLQTLTGNVKKLPPRLSTSVFSRWHWLKLNIQCVSKFLPGEFDVLLCFTCLSEVLDCEMRKQMQELHLACSIFPQLSWVLIRH